jgi:hypothetical protein
VTTGTIHPRIEEITVAENIEPTISSILDLQTLDKDMDKSEESCISLESKVGAERF